MWHTLTEVLHDNAQQHPDDLFTRFLEQGDVAATYTYAQMWVYANQWAHALRDAGLASGDRVVLALGNTAAFVGAYFGVLLIGGIPAPVVPLRAQASFQVDADALQTLARQVEAIQARVLIVPAEQRDSLQALPLTLDQQPTLLTPDQVHAEDRPPLEPSHDGSAIALFQFTSGTSGSPKVVQLSHAALIHQTDAIATALKLEDPNEDWAVSWLPMFHDMGLIGYLLTTAYCAGHVTFLLTEDFMQRPGLWFKALSDFKASITGGPPSAYVLCARYLKASELADLDLSRLRVALVGAETVTEQALDTVVERFAPCGLRRSSLMPTYGLAENGLAVTMPPLDQDAMFDTIDLSALQQTDTARPADSGTTQTRSFVSVGRAIARTEIKIVDNDDHTLDQRQVGEICVRSPSLMLGYYQQPQASADALKDGWLHTGDTGYLADDTLYVVGRKKELVIVGGQNYTPDDVEQAVVDASSVKLRRVVALSTQDAERATEKLVVLVETALGDADARADLRRSIRQSLVQRGYPAGEVVLVRPKTIEVTDTGKVKRADAKLRYLAGEFKEK